MPIYEYKCSDCGNVYEKRQKFSDPADTTCHCEKKAPVSRLTSAPAIVFKGSGWYITDYARSGNNGGKNGGSKDGATAGGSSSNGDGGTAAKSEATSSGASKPSESSSPAAASKP